MNLRGQEKGVGDLSFIPERAGRRSARLCGGVCVCVCVCVCVGELFLTILRDRAVVVRVRASRLELRRPPCRARPRPRHRPRRRRRAAAAGCRIVRTRRWRGDGDLKTPTRPSTTSSSRHAPSSRAAAQRQGLGEQCSSRPVPLVSLLRLGRGRAPSPPSAPSRRGARPRAPRALGRERPRRRPPRAPFSGSSGIAPKKARHNSSAITTAPAMLWWPVRPPVMRRRPWSCLWDNAVGVARRRSGDYWLE